MFSSPLSCSRHRLSSPFCPRFLCLDTLQALCDSNILSADYFLLYCHKAVVHFLLFAQWNKAYFLNHDFLSRLWVKLAEQERSKGVCADSLRKPKRPSGLGDSRRLGWLGDAALGSSPSLHFLLVLPPPPPSLSLSLNLSHRKLKNDEESGEKQFQRMRIFLPVKTIIERAKEKHTQSCIGRDADHNSNFRLYLASAANKSQIVTSCSCTCCRTYWYESEDWKARLSNDASSCPALH